MARSVIKLELAGLVAVHAARAVHTALTGVPGITTALVTMAGAEIEIEGSPDIEAFKVQVQFVLEPIGIGLISATVVQDRVLPLA